MLSLRAKSLPLFAGMAAMALTVPGFSARAQQVATSQPTDEQVVMQKLRAMDAEMARLKREGDAADARSANADKELACINAITADIEKNGAATANLTAMPPKEQACKVARNLGLVSG